MRTMMAPKSIVQSIAYRSRITRLTWHRGTAVFVGHSVASDTGHDVVSIHALGTLLAFLRREFTPLTLAEVVGNTPIRHSGRPGAALTLDDGYASNLHLLLPVLREHEMPATIFVTAGLIGTRDRIWPSEVRRCVRATTLSSAHLSFVPHLVHLGETSDREAVAELVVSAAKTTSLTPIQIVDEVREVLQVQPKPCGDDERMLTRDELAELAADPLITIGAHTVSHPILANLPFDEAVREIDESREALASAIGYRPEFLAYPNGEPTDYTPQIMEYLRDSGWKAAFTTEPRRVRPTDNPFSLPRIPIGEGPPSKLAWSLMRAK